MIKDTSLVLILIFSLSVFNLNAEVKNENKPLKGEWDFQLQKIWEVGSASDDILVEARQIQVDDDGKVYGNVYLLDMKYFKFFVFSPEGEFLFSFGKRGEGPGELKFPFSFFIQGNYIIVPDQGRIHYFTKKGKFVKTVNPGFMFHPKTFIDENRFIMVQDREDEKSKFEELEIYDINTKERSTIAQVTEEKSLTATSDTSQGQMVLKIKDANTTPLVVITAHNNELYFGKSDNYFLKKIDRKGNELLSFSIGERERKKIPMVYKKKRISRIKLNGQKVPEELAKQLIKGMPDYCTYFSAVTIEENGLIYVYLNDVTNETGREIDIFSPEGKYLYHAAIIFTDGLKPVSPMVIKRGYLYVFAEDDEGDRKLVKYKIAKPTG
jgi:hypothetical protein